MNKYLERRLPTGTGILAFKEKHDTRYFVCNTKEDFFAAAMKILKERYKANWYYDDEDDSLSQETCDYVGVVKRKVHLDLDKTRAKEIIDTNDLEAAFMFLDNRADYQYEQMDIEYPEDYQ